jgi:hypothetical protein
MGIIPPVPKVTWVTHLGTKPQAKKNLQENFSTINNIQKQWDQLKIAARTKHHLRRLKHKKR